MSEKHSIHCPARDIPVRAEADVLVVGGGPAGIMAAEAAAGDGLRVMLVESRSGSSTGCVHAAQRANTVPAPCT